tara:strand:- start:725 stop:1141 length:417 start_codon:yes stop_codon:yes gene_type:complete
MTKKPTPFTHVNDIYNRSSQFKGDEGYSQYVINKELSKNGELIDLVNVVQQYYSPSLDNKLHFKVMNSLFPYSKRPGFKSFPWIWKGSKKVDPIIEVIAKHFDESIKNSKVYYEILKSSREGKKQLKYLENIYGLTNV